MNKICVFIAPVAKKALSYPFLLSILVTERLQRRIKSLYMHVLYIALFFQLGGEHSKDALQYIEYP